MPLLQHTHLLPSLFQIRCGDESIVTTSDHDRIPIQREATALLARRSIKHMERLVYTKYTATRTISCALAPPEPNAWATGFAAQDSKWIGNAGLRRAGRAHAQEEKRCGAQAAGTEEGVPHAHSPNGAEDLVSIGVRVGDRDRQTDDYLALLCTAVSISARSSGEQRTRVDECGCISHTRSESEKTDAESDDADRGVASTAKRFIVCISRTGIEPLVETKRVDDDGAMSMEQLSQLYIANPFFRSLILQMHDHIESLESTSSLPDTFSTEF
ncbi:hypothetical protein FI667_g2438, partial [Globisporangium splendens]